MLDIVTMSGGSCIGVWSWVWGHRAWFRYGVSGPLNWGWNRMSLFAGPLSGCSTATSWTPGNRNNTNI